MADDKDIEGEEGGGGKKKLIIIIAAVVVLLLGGTVAAFLLMGGDDEAAGDEAAAEQQPAEEAEGEPLYVPMKPEFVVSLPAGGPAKMLQVAITVYTRQAGVSEFLTVNDPMLRHHLIELLEQQPSAELLTLEGKEKLQKAVQELLTAKLAEFKQAGEIKGVYFTEFVLQ